MTTLLFPGQGSQFKGMGAELFDAYPDAVARADAILGWSLRELCLDDPRRQLNDTRYTQPALYAVSVLALRRHLDSGGPPPDRVAGHSLGEYAALHAAGVFDFETGLRLVKRRGELMSAVTGGAMCAVIGLARADIEALLAEHGIDLDLANHNSPRQLVLAGDAEGVGRFETLVKSGAAPGARCVRLRVSGAFHSRQMAPVATRFAPALAAEAFAPPRIPVIANCSALAYGADDIAANLARQLHAPVRWVESVEALLAAGETAFIEIGPGEVLTRLVADIRADWLARGGVAGAAAKAEPAPAASTVASSEATPLAPPAAEAAEAIAEAVTPAPGPFEQAWRCASPIVAGGLGGDVAPSRMLAGLVGAGCLAFAGSDGVEPALLAVRLRAARELAGPDAPGRLGLNLVCDGSAPEREAALWRIAADLGIDAVELGGAPEPSPELLAFRAAAPGRHQVLVKLRDVASARAFLAPPSAALVAAAAGLPTTANAAGTAATAATAATPAPPAGLAALATLPLADAICLDCSDWRTAPADRADRSFAALVALRDAAVAAGLPRLPLGLAGGIATPADIAAARALGADFVLVGSALQWTADAGLPAPLRARLAAADAAFVARPDPQPPGWGLETVALRPAPDAPDSPACGPAAREAARWWRARAGADDAPTAADATRPPPAFPTAGELLRALAEAARLAA
ncbi:ACP S-malonyltransferase [Derxia gummosa]|uniref:[acyl-carrier-protein] S-malonyltransferase n=1 Tax=Derxia gummosa DSM 723 TaxID=1121388 RepID=A0A8B6XA29_9BURK|nr:ACP S-malonyltransferase [Derxia gummosa]